MMSEQKTNENVRTQISCIFKYLIPFEVAAWEKTKTDFKKITFLHGFLKFSKIFETPWLQR